jgi:hypothetical protein
MPAANKRTTFFAIALCAPLIAAGCGDQAKTDPRLQAVKTFIRGFAHADGAAVCAVMALSLQRYFAELFSPPNTCARRVVFVTNPFAIMARRVQHLKLELGSTSGNTSVVETPDPRAGRIAATYLQESRGKWLIVSTSLFGAEFVPPPPLILHATFGSAVHLRASDPVLVLGVYYGAVLSVAREGSTSRVTFTVGLGPVRTDTTVAVKRSADGPYLALDFGKSQGAVVPSGGTVRALNH